MIPRVAVAALVAVLSAGCKKPAPPALPPAVEVPSPELPVESPWPPTLAAVRTAIDSGRFATADTILVTFEQAHAGSPEANESAFWRALLRADPRNPAFTIADARAALDAYLSAEGAPRREEIEVLRRTLVLTDSLRAAQANSRAAADARDRLREEELQKLRDELQRTQAELDRIKRRLGSPKP